MSTPLFRALALTYVQTSHSGTDTGWYAAGDSLHELLQVSVRHISRNHLCASPHSLNSVRACTQRIKQTLGWLS
jgi:predicted small metal-binding protein